MTEQGLTEMYAGTIVEVEWVDAASTSGWQQTYDQDALGVLVCTSVGYLHSQDEDAVRITQSRNDNGADAELLVIPRVAVRSVREVQ